jgi:hypothetical protein
MTDELVYTVVDAEGAWAFLPDETAALAYAAKVRGSLGPVLSRSQAHELVERQSATKIAKVQE